MKQFICKVNEICIYEYITIGFFYCHNLYQVKHSFNENSTFTLNNKKINSFKCNKKVEQ